MQTDGWMAFQLYIIEYDELLATRLVKKIIPSNLSPIWFYFDISCNGGA